MSCKLICVFFSREEAGLHVRQQELPQRVFGSGPGSYRWASPGCSSQRGPLGHLTGEVLSHSIMALHEQKLLNKQAEGLNTACTLTTAVCNSTWFALNLPFLLTSSTFSMCYMKHPMRENLDNSSNYLSPCKYVQVPSLVIFCHQLHHLFFFNLSKFLFTSCVTPQSSQSGVR